MDTAIVPFLIVGAVLIVLIVNIYFSKAAIIKRQLNKAPLKSISQFKGGETAKIVGKALPVEEPLKAPLSGRECCHYYILVERKVQSGKNTSWRTLIEEEYFTNYVIEQNGFYAFLNSKDIRSHIIRDREYSSGFLNDATPELEAFLRKYGHESEDWLGFNKTIRYIEGIIEPGETLAVLAKGEWKPAETLELPAHYGNILSLTAGEEKKFIIMSDDSDVANVS